MSAYKTPYVLHEHNANRAGLHYDFRFKMPSKNLLYSFALPKAHFPNKIGEKCLAVRTNDHGRYWLFFQGEIPKGEYGAGTIKIIQKGELELLGLGPGYITFRIHGDIADGRFSLIKFKGKEGGKTDTWVLIKIKEKEIDKNEEEKNKETK